MVLFPNRSGSGPANPVAVPGPRATARYAAGMIHQQFVGIDNALRHFHRPYRLTVVIGIGPGWLLTLDRMDEAAGLHWEIEEQETGVSFAGNAGYADMLKAVDAALAAIPALPLY